MCRIRIVFLSKNEDQISFRMKILKLFFLTMDRKCLPSWASGWSGSAVAAVVSLSVALEDRSDVSHVLWSHRCDHRVPGVVGVELKFLNLERVVVVVFFSNVGSKFC